MFEWAKFFLSELMFAEPGYTFLFGILKILLVLAIAATILKIVLRPAKTYGSRYPLIGKIKILFFFLAVSALLIGALARPFTASSKMELRRGPVDIIVVMDNSVSFWGRDLGKLSRLEVAQREALRLVSQDICEKGDRLALFVFNKNTVREMYLSTDFDRFAHEVNMVGPPERMIGDEQYWFSNFALVLEHLYQDVDEQDRYLGRSTPYKARNRLVLFFTDGDDEIIEQRNLNKNVKEFQKRDLPIYLVGVGTPAGVNLLRILKERGYRAGEDYDLAIEDYWKHERTTLGMPMINFLTARTRGRYIIINKPNANATEFMRGVINSHRTLALTAQESDQRNEVWQYFLAAAVLVILLMIIFY